MRHPVFACFGGDQAQDVECLGTGDQDVVEGVGGAQADQVGRGPADGGCGMGFLVGG